MKEMNAMNIEVLGSDCTKCLTLFERTKEAAQLVGDGKDISVSHITDIAVIVKYAIATLKNAVGIILVAFAIGSVIFRT